MREHVLAIVVSLALTTLYEAAPVLSTGDRARLLDERSVQTHSTRLDLPGTPRLQATGMYTLELRRP